jgi:photosystem II stability/assembly factor-like uncharacterized protein
VLASIGADRTLPVRYNLNMCHGRPLLFALCALSAACGLATEPTPALHNDAQLTDVCSIDATHAWAVGDRGTIWHTDDGGDHWRLQTTEIDCRLSTVHFLDQKIGWAAGGWTHPYTHVTTGVILRTRDGGERWTYDRQSLLPAVRVIKFFDPANGIAVGQQSSLFPAGIFATDDGGRTWASLPPAGEHAWLTADFADPLSGLIAGRSGALVRMRRRAIEPVSNVDFGLRSVARVKLGSAKDAWLVGDGGLVMYTDDGGNSWQPPETELPTELRGQFDLSALAVQGDKVWLAGTPGTRVLHSPDGGRTWTAQSTGQTTPIRSLSFADDTHGCAVGDLGTILITHDSGATWQKSRAGGARAALFGVFTNADNLPLELFAKLSGDDGYLTAVALLARGDVETHSTHAAEAPTRAHESLVLAGACTADTAWRFPARQSGLGLTAEQIVEAWNRASDGHALERIDEYLVRTLRMWRPEVVVTSLSATRHPDPQAQLINHAVLQAVEHAADPSIYTAQLDAVGLSPWKVKKVYGTLPTGENGTVNIVTSQTTRNGQAVADLAGPPRGLIHRAYTASPPSAGFRLLVNNLPQDIGSQDFFSGIPLSPGGEARRVLREADRTVDALRRSAQSRRNLQAILARPDPRGGTADSHYLAEVTDVVRTMDEGHAADVLLQLAERYYHRGEWDLAADTFDMIVQRYPKHPATGSALVWLVQYYASSEAAWRIAQRQQFASAEGSGFGVQSSAKTENEELRAQRRPVQRTAAVLALPGSADDRPTRAAGYAKQLEQLSPALFAEPEVRFPLAVAHRNQGYPRQAERFYLGFTRTRSRDTWARCAQAEQWIGPREGEPSKRVWQCVRSAGKPRLDGKLNDAIWHVAKPVELKSPLHDDDEWPAIAMLAFDDEFLYLAVSCREASTPTSSTGPRPRDGDLSQHDRIELYLDLDRDYATAYHLAVDTRGWTNDACWGDTSWNPQWFVAAGRESDKEGYFTWTVEAAIPFSALSGKPFEQNQAWAVGVQRIVPKLGFQSWNTPAAIEPQPEGFGLLVFE